MEYYKKLFVSAAVREQLIISICSNGQSHLSPRCIEVVREIVKDGEYVSIGFDPALDAARKLIKKLDEVDNLS